jgi:hypothetical protein
LRSVRWFGLWPRRTASVQMVQRAQIIWRASRGESAAAMAAQVGPDGETVRKRIHRFNAAGVEALKDRHCSGRPPTYNARANRYRDRHGAHEARDPRAAVFRLDAGSAGHLPA